ncbi:MAG: GNAT family N-acetyltransferase [Culicoidibacterales bacterium]
MIKTRIPNLSLKPTTAANTQTILDFIKKLAIYEKMLPEVTATTDDLAESLFKQKAAEVFLVDLLGEDIGFVLITINFSTFVGKPGIYLEDLYLEPDYRGRGYGTEIFYQLAQLAQRRNYGRIDWACLDWNTPAIKFYEKMGAVCLDEWSIYRLDTEAIGAIIKKEEKR